VIVLLGAVLEYIEPASSLVERVKGYGYYNALRGNRLFEDVINGCSTTTNIHQWISTPYSSTSTLASKYTAQGKC